MQLVEVQLSDLVNGLASNLEEQPRRRQPRALTIGTGVLHHDLVEPCFHPRVCFAALAIPSVVALDPARDAAESHFASRLVGHPDRLADAKAQPSVGSVGDSYDNALAETIIGLYKTEVIHRRGPWRHLEAVEYATLEWVDWFNHRRLLEPIGNVPPAELESSYYLSTSQLPMAA